MSQRDPRDRSTLENVQVTLARLEAQQIQPPEGLAGDARVMFAALVEGNLTRPWNQSHALALADYCRITVMWGGEMRAIEAEGALVGGKPNAHFASMKFLSMERLRLGRLLGLAGGVHDAYLSGTKATDQRLRAVGSSMARTLEDSGKLLA